MKKITLKEIAQYFGVSISTVSKAINDSHEISDGLKAKIQQFAKDNKYRPNKVALSLLQRKTKTIGVVVPNILNYFFTQVFSGIEKVANERGYILLSCISDESYEKEVATLEFLGGGTVDGLIVSMAEETQFKNKLDHFQNILDEQIPLVMFDRVSDEILCDKVVVDDFEAGYKTTKYFINLGCRTVALVTAIDHSSVGKLRVEGYRKALEEANIPFDDKLILRVGKEDDMEVLVTFLLNYKSIDGIMALDEITAVEVLKLIKSRGYRVPEDISVIGFTNGKLSRYVSPALTAVSQHGTYIGETAAKVLIERIESKEYMDCTTKVIKTSLIVRDSTKRV
ncbi:MULTISPECIES: LacI family DNA-binding transcriptional regulator [Arenibacter]|uniref:LacI family DNA-binding transcriptional regulator n=1 Tax=Arenibacter TaxID=178469 RepID=UPI001C0675AD|nr:MULTISPECIES: LacI family DNA-binding transcriptional regulator [Arenibacter]MBU2904636.1 LacI family transcriptional regulator [Arenibacter algicola]MCK0133923.1 LacI family transcriptional regulator [Arenibacter sp. S6351L]